MTASGQVFTRFALAHGALELGDFTLKSGRRSPYFFNLGAVSSGAALTQLGDFYADAIAARGVEFDVVFGPAYKGIPLASVTAVALHQRHGRDTGVAYNRKEVKRHGESGQLVGAALASQRVLIVDDVMTAGTAVREALKLITQVGGTAVGVAVGFDRKEPASGGDSAMEALAREYHLRTVCIADFDDLLSCVTPEQRGALESYMQSLHSST